LSYDLQANVNNTSEGGNSISSSFIWTISPNSNITGASDGSGTTINQILYNVSNVSQNIVYTVIPKATGAGTCEGNPFTVTVTVPVCSSIVISKIADKTSVSAAGDVINYLITVENVGNTSQNNVVVSDPYLGGVLLNPTKTGDTDNVLEKGESWIYAGTYTVLQSDIDNNGKPTANSAIIRNTASVITTELTTPQTATSDVGLTYSPSMSLTKSVTETTYSHLGDVLHYSIVLKNTGNVTLSNVVVTDVNATLTSGGTIASITPGVSETISAQHIIVQSDLDGKSVTNTATASGKDSKNSNVSATSNDVVSTLFIVPIDAVDDNNIGSPAHGKLGGISINNVLSNDKLNNVSPVSLLDINLTQNNTTNSNITLNPLTGAIYVAPNTPSGIYTVTYQICEKSNPGNCDTATATVQVVNTIDAVNDTPAAVSSGESTPSVIGNDTLGGHAAVIGTNNGQVTLSAVSVPSGLTLNADGTITVGSSTPGGVYTVTYQICENGASPGNCDTATATVQVVNTIDAVNDTPVAVGSGESTPSVIGNDTLGGHSAVIGTNNGEVTLTGLLVPSGLTLNIDGTITVGSSTPGGIYTVTYQICENSASPGNCDTATATVQVVNTIDAVNDTPAAVSSGESTPSVIGNDTLGGHAAVIGTNNGQVTLTGLLVPLGLTLNADGTITVGSSTPGGVYTVTYQICENGASPGNCDTTTATVQVVNTIDAVNDTPAAVSSGESTPSVIGNDTLDGHAAVIGTNNGQVTLSAVSVPSGLTLNADGTITVGSSTPGGVYTVTYQICENGASPGNCDTATATVSILNNTPVASDDSKITPEDTPVSGTVTATDEDGDPLTYTKGSDPSHGTVSVDINGNYTYSPNLNYNGTDSFTITVSDGHGGTATATVTIIVTPVNDNPVASDDSMTTPEDTSVSGTVTATDVDGDLLTYSKGSDPSHGTVSVDSNGNYTYTPNADYNGTDSFTVTVSDGHGGTDTATVTITVTPVSDTPVAVDDVIITQEDNPISGDVSINDIPSADGVNTWSVLTGPSHGTISMGTDGHYTYTPNANWYGTETITYQLCDIDSDCSVASLVITVSAVNDPPIAYNDTKTTPEDTPVSGTVSATDVDGDALTYSKGSDPAHGTVTINSNGTYTYTPGFTYNGTDNFTVVVSDGHGGTATATITIIVTSVNNIPTISDDMKVTKEDIPVSGYLTASDLDGDVLSFSKTSNPSHGTVVLEPDGFYAYFPNKDYNGTDSFNVMVSDGHGGYDEATVTIIITPVNDAPVTNDDSKITNEDTPVSGKITATDPDGDVLTYTKGGGPQHGKVTIDNNGNYTYTPDLDYNGNDSFIIVITDGNGGTATSTVSIVVLPVNDLPLAVDDVIVTLKGIPASGAVSVNDKPSGDGGNVYSLVTNPTNGTVTLDSNGSYTYKPNMDYLGTDKFIYKLCDANGDCSTATVTVTVIDVSIALIKTSTISDSNMDGVKGNVGDQIKYSFIVTNTGTVSLTNILVTDPKVTVSGGPITLAAGAVDRTSFTATYTITTADIQKGSVTNQAKVEGDDFYGHKATDLSDGKSNKENNPTVTTVAGGALTIIKEAVLVDSDNDGVKGNAGDVINYKFIVSNVGSVTLTNVTVTDPMVKVSGGPITLASGAVDRNSFSATYTITAADIKNGSVINQAKVEGSDPIGNIVSDLSDPSDNKGNKPTVTPVAGGAIGIIKTYSVINANNDGSKGNAGDQIKYSFIVTNTGSVTLTNVMVTDAKVAVSGEPITLLPGQVDDKTFSAVYTITEADVKVGTISNQAKVEGTDLIGNKVSDLSDGSSNTANEPTITPLASGAIALIKTAKIIDVNGDGIKGNIGDKISYLFTVTNTGKVRLTNVMVTDPNVTIIGGPVSLEVGAVDKTSFTAVYTITYNDLLTGTVTNQASVEGTDALGNKVSDLSDDNSNTENDPTVTDVNDIPIAINDEAELPIDQILTGSVGDNDKLSQDGDNTWTLVTQPTKGTIMFNPDGSYIYTPLPDFSGTDSFTYKICDSDGDCSEAMVTIIIEDIVPDQVFTPNGDGQNDTYFIKGIDRYPSNKVTILNRWGNTVYEKVGYLNEWDGYANVKKIGNVPLPVGTYYFLIQYGNNRHKTGFVYLER
jgi:gliding motility-associated-like protein/uncharacterized repeat protein (TIGR01451 family)